VGYFFGVFMECPSCKGRLKEALYEGFPVYCCSSCKGIWIEGSVLLKILSRRKVSLPPEAIEAAHEWRVRRIPKSELQDVLECPVCHARLNRSVYAYDTGIVIDRCLNGCGIWLDAGELEALKAFDEVWDSKSREVFASKGLQLIFDEPKGEDPETAAIRKGFLGRSVVGRLADIFVDFLS